LKVEAVLQLWTHSKVRITGGEYVSFTNRFYNLFKPLIIAAPSVSPYIPPDILVDLYNARLAPGIINWKAEILSDFQVERFGG
jgi:hypothetical protein